MLWPHGELTIENIPEAIMVVTQDGVLESCNRFLLELLEYESAYVRGRPIRHLFPDETGADEFLLDLRNGSLRQEISDRVARLKSGSGNFLTFSYRARPLDDPTAGRVGYVVILVDQRLLKKRQEIVLSRSKFLDEIPFPFLRIAGDGTLLYANKGSWLLLSYWQVEIGQQVPEQWRGLVKSALETKENAEIEVQVSFKTILLALVPVIEAGYVNVFGLDVTRRKQMEQKLLLDAQVFESATEGVMITDSEKRILDVNLAFRTITGYSREEILG